MKLITLMENTPGKTDCICEHGLSIYIETQNHKILLDTGATDGFLKNARQLGIDLSQVDILILSHGHYDHAGGILEFVKWNPHAKIYMRPEAVKAYYHLYEEGAKYIGIQQAIAELPQVVFTGERELIDEGISVFSDVTGRRLWPKGNLHLKCLEEGQYVQDTFQHEQYLVLHREQEKILISGCAHNGILNILDKYREIYDSLPDKVITGFHMKKKTSLTAEEKSLVIRTGEELKRMENTVFYSGHCTGEEAFGVLKELLGERLIPLHSGEQIL